jgi:DNA repair ATPase RecN
MSENNNDFFVETYIKKQETLFLEQMRRLLQADTKSTVLELALNERDAKINELEEQVRQLNTAISQAVNGLQSITNERDALKNKLQEANEKIEYISSFQDKYKTAENELVNKTVIVDKLSTRVQTYQKDMDQMKENYNKVNSALEEANDKLSKLSNIKSGKKKLISTDSEWTDGNQV